VKAIRLKTCPLCGDINPYGSFCDHEAAHPGQQPALVEEVYLPRSAIDKKIKETNWQSPDSITELVAWLRGVDLRSEKSLSSPPR
jgi:hypothetical protein